MDTYLLTWNPNKWTWAAFEEARASINAVGHYEMDWSCGNRKTMPAHSRFFLLRQGRPPLGIIGSGITLSEPFEKPHWNNVPGRTCNYVTIRFDRLFDATSQTLLPRAALKAPPLAHTCWNSQSSGVLVPPSTAQHVEHVWRTLVDDEPAPSYEPPIRLYAEGSAKTVTLTRYERSKGARQACLEHFGDQCVICQMSFTTRYGVPGLIHVHHTTALASIGQEYFVNPREDLRPVCPNCHAVIHSKNPAYTIEQVQQMLNDTPTDKE